MNPTFQPVDDRPGLTVVDPVENKQYPFQTSGAVSPHSTDAEGFYFPVDAAVSFTTNELVLPYVVPIYVRDPSGEMILEAEHYAYETLPEGTYILELMAPIKLYVRVRSGLTIASSDDRLSFDFGGPTSVRLGARSRHKRPAATVATTAEPADLARAVSTFGSALKTTRCDRSLPSFRGHPPRLVLEDELRIPEGVESPDTGITIVVPPERTAVYAVSPLAYYLGATVETGSYPRIETDRGFEFSLDRSDEPFDRTVQRVLEHVFFFDCVTRTEGLYQVDLHERRRLEERVELAFDELYEAPLADRLATVLSVPFETVADLAPQWHLVTHATAASENVATLPFLANELSVVRTAPEGRERDASSSARPAAIDEFTRSSTRSAEDDLDSASIDSYVSPPDVDAFEQAWLGDGVPIGANKLSRTAFENGLDRSTSSEGVEVTIVCNDPKMAAEFEASEDGLYGEREKLPFDVTVHRNVSSGDLRRLFAEDVDFLHYVGHVRNGAFVCSDGTLDTGSLPDIGVDAFLLNGCRSYDVGTRLIEEGGVGGIVTLSEVGNQDAIAVGRFVAKLLNNGFTLRSAVSLARSHRLVGNQYIVVGDGGVAVGQAGSGVPNSCRIDRIDDETYRLQLRLYHVDSGVGAQYIPYLDGVDCHFLAGNELPPMEVSGETLSRFLRLAQIPVEYDEEFCWSTDDRFATL
ncbi:hypothetical protein [Natronococcus pandeyae]|uniref:hypothetical protein n=1 Tax=Natronococcus pandeyae TaxID=2055836 RepID=UPI001F1F423A|nr:hypothetical protein [Natronococcus pandeyae]